MSKVKKESAHFTIRQNELAKLLQMAGHVAEKSDAMPVVGYVKIQLVEGANIKFTATDLDMWICLGNIVQGEGSAKFCVNASVLSKIANEMEKDSDILFTLEAKENPRVIITCGDSRYTLPTFNADDFPESAPLAEDSIAIDPQVLLYGLEQVTHAMSEEETRYYLCGVYLDTQSKNEKTPVHFVATDGNRLAFNERELALQGHFNGVGILPAKLVAVLAKIIKNVTQAKMLLAAQRLQITGEMDNFEFWITSKLIDGTFPDWQRIVPYAARNRVTLPRAPLLVALRRAVSIVTDKDTRRVRLSIENNQLVISTSDVCGEAVERVMLNGPTPAKLTIGFESKYLQEALTALGGENVDMVYGSETEPVVFVPEGIELNKEIQRLQIVMPMRI